MIASSDATTTSLQEPAMTPETHAAEDPGSHVARIKDYLGAGGMAGDQSDA